MTWQRGSRLVRARLILDLRNWGVGRLIEEIRPTYLAPLSWLVFMRQRDCENQASYLYLDRRRRIGVYILF